MSRANRYFIPGCVWHITHRCHKKEFLFKFSKDRKRWLHWLFEAKKRYGLCVLNYVVTSNHVHLLVKDTGKSVISKSIQLVAGRTAQEFNNRKQRKGAFWEDRYHATAVESDTHLFQCMAYIDLNMIRAGVVSHPSEWMHGGYREIQSPPARYRIINIPSLMALCGVETMRELQLQHERWVVHELKNKNIRRDPIWTESIAVGSASFIDKVNASLGLKTMHRSVIKRDDGFIIKEDPSPYTPLFDSEKRTLSPKNTYKWDI